MLIRGLVVFAIAFTLMCGSVGADAPLEQLKRDVTAALQKQFPNAELKGHANAARDEPWFAHKLRTFTTYSLDKAGDWQDEHKRSAPDRGGLSLQFYVEDGPWMGQLAVPCISTEDRYIFKDTHFIANTASGKMHVWAHIATPRVDAPDDALGELIRVFKVFAENH